MGKKQITARDRGMINIGKRYNFWRGHKPMTFRKIRYKSYNKIGGKKMKPIA